MDLSSELPSVGMGLLSLVQTLEEFHNGSPMRGDGSREQLTPVISMKFGRMGFKLQRNT